MRRRTALATLSSAAALPLATLLPARLGLAAVPLPGDRRFVLVVLRGGLDGLWAVPAPGDPAFADARGALGRHESPPLPLDAPFALNPALPAMHGAWRRGELLVLHATALPYRERSHFDAQQMLESGGLRPHDRADGWLGRALAAAGGGRPIALTTAVPLVLRGGPPVDTWAPSTLPDPDADLLARVQRAMAGDEALAAAMARAAALHADPMTAQRGPSDARTLATRAAAFLAADGGPAVAMLEVGGWDSHAGQAQPAFARRLQQLDGALDALREGMGPRWARTVVLVATEFGRTVAPNGTGGTDHGTGGAAWLLGGAVRGGRVLGDWPGLAPAARFEGRDLRATTDLRALLHGVLHEHLRIARGALDREVLPGVSAPLRDLVREPSTG